MVENKKICSKCGEEKNLDRFGVDKRSSDGLLTICKQCNGVYFREYYHKKQK